MSMNGENTESRIQSRATGYSDAGHGRAAMQDQRLPIEMDGTRGEMVFGGPSNVGQHRVTHVVDHNVFLGIGQASTEKTSELRYICRAPSFAPSPRHQRVGEVGWNYNTFKEHAHTKKRQKPNYGATIEQA